MTSTTIALLVLVSVQSVCGQLAGGWFEANTTSKDVLDAAKNGLNLYEGPDANRILLLDVLNASQQVVAGMNYRLKLRNALSSCPVKENFHRACFIEETMTCNFEIFRSLNHTYNLTSSTCGNRTSSWSKVQTDGRIVVNSISSAVHQMSKSGRRRRELKLNRIEAAFENIEMPGIYKASVFLSSKCPPCISAAEQFMISKAVLFVSANMTSSHLMDCKTDSPFLKSLTRCGISPRRL